MLDSKTNQHCVTAHFRFIKNLPQARTQKTCQLQIMKCCLSFCSYINGGGQKIFVLVDIIMTCI
uniref:Conotoxin-like unassigned superfamily 12 n=1 Tax=Conus ermineus TaxID=55423 RepID=A0A346CIK4_CONER|nr:conotoxin-like precursor unassigned superfamily 12 [Conus ermineus]